MILSFLGLAVTFLSPLSGVWLAAVAAPLLLLLYFLKLRRRPVRVSSTLLWLTSTADLEVNAPFRWIRPSWQLLLQLLALALLCVAASRPSVDRPATDADVVILLIDRSASMSARDVRPTTADAGPSRFDEAKRQARQYLDRLDGRTSVMVLSFADRAEPLTSLTRDRGLAARAIETLQPTDAPADLGAALELLSAVAAQSRQEPQPRAVTAVLFSDGGDALAAEARGIASRSITPQFVRVGPPLPEAGSGASAGSDNAGIVALAAERNPEEPASVRLFARVVGVSGQERRTTLTCRVDGEIVAIESVTLAPASWSGPSDAGVNIEFLNTEGGLVELELAGQDALSADDRATMVLRPPAPLRMALVRPAAARDEVDAILLEALRALNPGALDTLAADEWERRAGAAQEYDLVVFDRVRPAASPPVPTLSFGAGVPEVSTLAPDDPRAVTPIVFWLRSHPVMRYVALSDVFAVGAARLGPVEIADERLVFEALATGNGGPIIALAQRRGVPRLVVGFDLGASNWVKLASFHVFLANAVDHLTLRRAESRGVAWRTGQEVLVQPAPGAEELRITGPAESTHRVPATWTGEAVSVGALPRVGVYEVSGAREGDRVVPVNLLNERESRIESRESIELGPSALAAQSLSALAPRELWPWFVLGALLVLTAEWLLFAWRMRV
ncbi:MAG: VWA domain-containing protein [Planctomycetota bacterium]|nr:VWA domain-containing protein [Planctomycetota bacterium]